MSHPNKHLFTKLLIGFGGVCLLTLLSAAVGPRPLLASTDADERPCVETASAQR